MIIPTYMTIIVELFKELQLLLNHFVYDAYTALVSYLKVPLGLAVVLYISLLGVSISQGWVKLSMSNLTKSAVKIGLIYLAAMNWGWFSHYVMALFNQGASQLGAVLMEATPIPLPHFAGEGIEGAMQSVLIEFVKIGAWLWAMSSWHSFSPCFTAILIWGFGFAMILVAIFELVLAKIMLAILFATAPLFIAFTLFKPTHGFFDRWLGACVGFSLLTIFVSSILVLTLSICQWAVGETYLNHAAGISLVGFIPVMVVGSLGIGITLKAAHLAQSIGGTVTTSSGSALLAGIVGGAISTLKIPVRGGESLKDLLKSKSDPRNAGQERLLPVGSSMTAIRNNLTKTR